MMTALICKHGSSAVCGVGVQNTLLLLLLLLLVWRKFQSPNPEIKNDAGADTRQDWEHVSNSDPY